MFNHNPMIWLIIVVILVLVFGASRLPMIAKNVGKSAKILKSELNDMVEEDTESAQPDTPAGNAAQTEDPQAKGGKQLPMPDEGK